jgi:hypothetical protein
MRLPAASTQRRQLELERSSQLHSETIQRPVRYMLDSGPIDSEASLRGLNTSS